MQGHIQKRISKKNVVSYSAMLDLPRDPDGSRRQRRLGTVRTKKEAEKLITDARYELSRGSFVEPSALTVAQWLEQWLSSVESKLRPSTVSQYRHVVRDRLVLAFGATLLAKLTPSAIEAQYALWLASGISRTTVRGWHVRLSSALAKAVRQKLLLTNPAARGVVDAPKPSTREMETWTVAEVRAFMTATENDRLAALWRLSLDTGLRRGELLGLRWADVDQEHQTLSVTQALTVDIEGRKSIGPPKTESSRRLLELATGTVAALRQHRMRQLEECMTAGPAWIDSDLVFCYPDGRCLNPSSIHWWYKRAIKRAGVRDIRIHDQRHTHATLLFANGEHPKIVQTRLGHKSVATTLDRYSHVAAGMQRDAAERLSKALADG